VDKRKVESTFTAIILCAGFGSRIKKTTGIPKTLLKINGSTIIEKILNSLKKNKINNINIVTGYKGHLIRKHLSKKYKNELKINFIKNEDPKKLGNAYSLYLGVKKLNSNILIIDGDLIFDEKIISIIDTDQKDQILVGKGKISDIECAKTLVDKENFVKKTIDKRAISKKEKEKYRFIGEAIGIIKISKNNIKKFKKHIKIFFKSEKNLALNWEHLINFYVKKNRLNYLKINKKYKWLEIDTPMDYKKAINFFKNEKI